MVVVMDGFSSGLWILVVVVVDDFGFVSGFCGFWLWVSWFMVMVVVVVVGCGCDDWLS